MKKKIIGSVLIIIAFLFSACGFEGAENAPKPTIADRQNQNNFEQGANSGGNDNEDDSQKEIMALNQVIITPALISDDYFSDYNYKYSDDGRYVYLCSLSLLISSQQVFSDEEFFSVYISPDIDKNYIDKSNQKKLELNNPCVFDNMPCGIQFITDEQLYLSICIKNFFMTFDGKIISGAGDAIFNLEFNLTENQICFYDITADNNLNGFKSGGMVFDLSLLFINN